MPLQHNGSHRPDDEIIFACDDNDNSLAHLVLGFNLTEKENLRLETKNVAVDIPCERIQNATTIGNIKHSRWQCFDKQCRLHRRVNVDYSFKYHDVTGQDAERFINLHEFNTVIYAPQCSGKTTLCTMLRYSGYDALECNNLFNWPTNTKNSLLLTSKPQHMELGRNKICIKPSCEAFYARQETRFKTIQNYKMKDYSIFKEVPPETFTIRTDELLSELFK